MGLDKCMHLEEFLASQMDKLNTAINEDKWYLSEKAGRDVGYETAKKDFFGRYFGTWAENFRREYCQKKCKEAGNCKVYKFCP